MLKTDSTDNDLIEFRRQVDIQLKEIMQDYINFLQGFEARLVAAVSKLSVNRKK